jgi:cytochrome c-type biogenesis protein CcmE
MMARIDRGLAGWFEAAESGRGEEEKTRKRRSGAAFLSSVGPVVPVVPVDPVGTIFCPVTEQTFMANKRVRAVVSVFIVGGALSLLLFTTMSEGASLYKHVDEVMASPQQYYGRDMNLHGFVETVEKKPNTLDYRFSVKTGDKVLYASYTGVIPDTMKQGAEVVLTGRLHEDGFAVSPNGIMAKCPSKYDPAADGKK